jgi:putative transcriptional regulator
VTARRSPRPDALRSARENAGLSQTDAAALVHASLRGWQQWEAGDRRMHPAMWELFEIKTALDARNQKSGSEVSPGAASSLVR